MSSDKDLKIQEMFKRNTILINQIDSLNVGIEVLQLQLKNGADRINQLEDENAELKDVLKHRENCIDWIQENYPAVISAYLERK